MNFVAAKSSGAQTCGLERFMKQHCSFNLEKKKDIYTS